MGRETVLVRQQSPPETKIALFRSLFRGREDVYPRRFESLRTGKSGTLLPVPTNGFKASAKSRESSARTVSTVGFFR